MRRIAILQGARLSSSRLPAKLLKTIGGARLLDIGLRRLASIREAANVSVLLACAESDREIWDAAYWHGIERAPISTEAAAANGWREAFGALQPMLSERFDWLIDGNFLCRPFLSVAVVQHVAELARTANGSLVTASRSRRLIWDGSGVMIFGNGQTANGVSNPDCLIANHLAYVIPAAMLGDEEEASKAQPVEVPLSRLDEIDIDTAADLAFARLIGGGE